MIPRGIQKKAAQLLQNLQSTIPRLNELELSKNKPITKFEPVPGVSGNKRAGSLTLDKVRKAKLVVGLIIGLSRRNPIGLFPTLLDLQDYVIAQAPVAAVNNQQIHQTHVVNDPAYISGQFTF